MANRISDGAPVINDTNVASAPWPLLPIARLADGDDTVNKHRYSGKRFGSLVIGEGNLDSGLATTHTLYMAGGDLEGGAVADATWYSLSGAHDQETEIEPTEPTYVHRAGSDSKPNMGQSKVEGNGSNSWHMLVNAMNISVVPVAELSAQDSRLNNTLYSGKDLLRCIIADEGSNVYHLYFAESSASDGRWIGLDGTTEITPSGGEMDAEHQVGTKPGFVDTVAGDGKHTAYDPICVSLINSYITNAELADIDSDINSGGLNGGGKRQGAVYFAADALELPLVNPGFWTTFGPFPDSAWSNLSGVAGVVPS